MNKRNILLIYLFSTLYCGWLLLSITGVTGTLNPDLPDLWSPGYIWPVLIHSLYGLFLFTAIVTTGVTILHLSAKIIRLDNNDIRILGFPTGMIACLCVAMIAQLGIAGQYIAFLTIIGSFAYYYSLARVTHPFASQYAALVLILAVAMGAIFSFIWKPTIESHTGSTGLGDESMYSGWYYSLKASVYPFYHLGEEGAVSKYSNQLHTFYALGLDVLPHFNISLFNMAGISSLSVLSIAYMLRGLSLYRSSIDLNPLSQKNIILITMLFTAAARYPSWIVESPPVAFMAPITLAVLYAVSRAGDNVLKLGFALALAIIGSAISKIVTVAVLGSYTGIKFLQWILRHANPVYFLLLGIFICIIGVYVIYMLNSFGPLFLTEWNPGPEFWPRFVDKGWGEFYKVIPKLLKDIGLVLIVAGIWQLKDVALFLASVMAATTHFVFPYLFTPTPAALLILLAGYIIVIDSIPKRAGLLLLLGALSFLPHHFRHDPGGWHPLMLWAFTLGTTVYFTLLVGSYSTTLSANQSNTKWIHVLCTLVLVSLTLTSLANGNLRVGKKKLELVPVSLYDIWKNTRENTPEDTLIFTDQTGANRRRLSGWNDYSLMAQRQFYISTPSNGPMRYENSVLQERLSNNDAILSGVLAPTELSLSKRYSAYFAVLSSRKIAPATFKKIYSNSDYVLYQIEIDHHIRNIR
jgi:hypothetical protein